MLGSILVFGFIVITLAISLAFYYVNFQFRFLSLLLLFAWSSFSFFLIPNYEGWPTSKEYPYVKVISIEVREDIEKIFVLAYDVSGTEYRFWVYNPSENPRNYSIPYTEKSKKAFNKAKEALGNGYEVFLNAPNETITDIETKKSSGTVPGEGDLLLPYETDKPAILAENPRNKIQK